MPSVKVNDINIFYELHGQGEPLVLITGLGNDVTQYAHIVAMLAQRYCVLAFDNRGAGRTEKPDAPYKMEQMADDTAALMDKLGIGPAHVIGISMGGRVAMALALQHPARVRSLVLVSTFARRTGMTRSVRMFSFQNRIPVFRKGLSKYPQPYYAFSRQLKASRSYDAISRLNEITVPTLVLHGKKDTLAPVGLAEETHAGIEKSKMITFEGGHIFFMGAPEKFCLTIFEFLQGIDG